MFPDYPFLVTMVVTMKIQTSKKNINYLIKYIVFSLFLSFKLATASNMTEFRVTMPNTANINKVSNINKLLLMTSRRNQDMTPYLVLSKSCTFTCRM